MATGQGGTKWYAYYIDLSTPDKKRGYYVIGNMYVSFIIFKGIKYVLQEIPVYRRVGGKKVKIGAYRRETQIIIRYNNKESFLDGKLASDVISHLKDLLLLIEKMKFIEDDPNKIEIIKPVIEPLLVQLLPILRWE